MKKFIITSVIFILIYLPLHTISQNKCTVLLESISTTYEGKCKKGLANGTGIATGIDTYNGRFKKGYPHGDGEYTWATGEVYIGEWEFGKRHGIGTYKYKYNGKDSIMVGVWKNNLYVGPIPPPPVVIQKRNIEKYTFSKQGDHGRLAIEIFMNGTINTTIEDLSIISSNGSYQNYGSRIMFNEIIYPCNFKVTYRTWNKFQTQRYDVVFEFKIYEEGDWMVKLYN